MCRNAEKYGEQYVKEFAAQMLKHLGMRVFVLTAHKDTKDVVAIAQQVYFHSF